MAELAQAAQGGRGNLYFLRPDRRPERPTASRSGNDLQRKPPCNTTYVDAFPFDTTAVITTGTNALLYTSFTVQRTESTVAKLFGRTW